MKAMDVRRLVDYTLEKEFKIQVFPNKVDLVNYKELGTFTNNTIKVSHEDGTVTIKGENLAISRLLKDEVLITGIIKTIELG